MNINKDKWVIKYKEDGTFWYASPYIEDLAWKFVSEVWGDTRIMYMFWGSVTPEAKWRLAQSIYEKYKEELPASYLASYLP